MRANQQVFSWIKYLILNSYANFDFELMVAPEVFLCVQSSSLDRNEV